MPSTIEKSEGFTLGTCRKCKKACEKRASWCRVCLNAHKSRLTRERKRRQDNYYKNIKPAKTQADLESGVVLPPDIPTVLYDNYKEPLKPVAGGYGYHGVVALNEARTHIQCHICGNFYQHLPGHLYNTHKTNARSYKQEYGLAQKTALVGEHIREAMIKSKEVRNTGQEGLLPGLRRYYENVAAGLVPAPEKVKRERSHWTLEKQNELGLCPAQTIEKLQQLAKEMGQVPTQDEFKDHYKYRYMSTIRYHFGNWREYCRQAGLTAFVDQRTEANTPEKLIGYLQDFYKEHGRVPMNSDFKRGIITGRYHYFKHFGTLNHARIEAGLPAVIPIPGHRYILVPPEKFDAYQQLKDEVPNKKARAKLGITTKLAFGEIREAGK